MEFSNEFTLEELGQVYQAFSDADTNGDGHLDYEEFAKIIAPHLLVADQSKELFSSFDKDKNGKIDIVEFTSALTVAIKGTPQQKLEALFKLYDLDGNKVLTSEEVNKVLNHLRSACAKLMNSNSTEGVADTFATAVINKLDLNKDGRITLEEWITGGITTPQLVGLLGINA